MRIFTSALLLILSSALLTPTALAWDPGFGPGPGACIDGVTADECWPGGDVCFYGGSRTAPVCKDVPCRQECISLSYCVFFKGDACRGYLACVGNLCVVDPCYTTMCFAAPAADPNVVPVGACAKENGCWGQHDVCVSAFSWVPQCADVPRPCEHPYFECASPIRPS